MGNKILRKYYFLLISVTWCRPDFQKKKIRKIKIKYRNTVLCEIKKYKINQKNKNKYKYSVINFKIE